MSRTTRNSNIKLLAFLIFGCALLGGGFLLRMKYPSNEKQITDEVRLLIKSESALWNPKSGSEVYLRLSGLQGSLEATSKFILESIENENAYQAPVDPILKKPLPPNSVSRFSGSNVPVEVLINPVSLQWGKTILGDKPNQRFHDLVPSGKYRLRFDMSVRSMNGAKPGEWKSFSSNSIEIEVAK